MLIGIFPSQVTPQTKDVITHLDSGGRSGRTMTEGPALEQFESNRRHLRSVAYRMLGSLSEAEDAVQECWLRLNRSDAGIINDYKGWLTTVVSRICLDILRSRRLSHEGSMEEASLRTRASKNGDPEQEALLVDSVGIALLVLLDRLSPQERIAYVLHDLFGFSFEQIAELLNRSSVSARQLASRARRQIRGVNDHRHHRVAQQREIVSRFLSALRSGDVERLIAVLDPDLVVRMDPSALPPGTSPVVHGARAWASQAITYGRHINHIGAALVNGHVGILLAPQGHIMRVLRLTFIADRIAAIEIVADANRLARLRLEILDGLNS
jgi:RNA polymerase sigma factor (sigma-70 family)